MPVTYGATGVSPRTNTYVEAKMLSHAGPVMVLEKTALTKQMPKNKTETITFRRPRTFTAATAPMAEGVTPSPTAFRYDDVAVALKQYGMVSIVTDKIEDLHEDPVLNDAAQQSGENIGRTTEALDWAVVQGGTNAAFANGSQRDHVNTPVTLNHIRNATRALSRQKGERFREIIDGGPNFATFPIEASWIAMGHTDLESDIRNLPGFVPVSKYAGRQTICQEEVGVVENVRFVLSPDLTPFLGAGAASTAVLNTGGNADVYSLMFFAKEAWGRVRLRGQGAISPTIIPVGQKDKSDPLGQRGYVGWKMWYASLRLNEAWMLRLEVAATAL